MKLAIIGKYGQLAQAAKAYSEIKMIDSIIRRIPIPAPIGV